MKNLILYLACLSALVISLTVWMKSYARNDLAYADISQLVDNYKLKKDMEAVSSSNLYKIRSVIDSLKMVKKMSSGGNAVVDSQIARAEFAFTKYYQQANIEINKKVWERLNPLIESYGKKNHLQLLIGANGAGTLLYADKQRDITQDLIVYINDQYERPH